MTYAAEVLADAPTGYWHLDESSGTVAADAAGANPGAYVNTPTLAAPSLLLDGVGSAVACVAASQEEITLPGNPISTNGTFEVWFRWTAGVTLLRDSASSTTSTWLVVDNNGQLSVRAGGTLINCSISTATVRDGNRHHLAIRKSGASIIVYVDSQSVGSTSAANNNAATMPWHLGRNGTNAQYADTTFDEVAVYTTALSAARIAAHYTAGGPEINVTAAYPGGYVIATGPTVVSGDSGDLEKVTVSLHLTHSDDGELTLLLTGPDGRGVVISDREGSGGADYGASSADADRTVLDDAAGTAIWDGTPPFVGAFQPEIPLDLFIGGPSEGTWTLTVVDDTAGNIGSLVAASVFLTVGGVTTRYDIVGLPAAIPDNDPGGVAASVAVSSGAPEVDGGAILTATSSMAAGSAVFTPVPPPPAGMRAPNSIYDPATGVVYTWPVNHSTEDPLNFSRQYQAGARTTVGLSRQQEASDPARLRLQGTILEPTQKDALEALYLACDDGFLEFTDFAGDAYRVVIVAWDVRPERAVNPVTGGLFIWRFTMELEIVSALFGPVAATGVLP